MLRRSISQLIREDFHRVVGKTLKKALGVLVEKKLEDGSKTPLARVGVKEPRREGLSLITIP